MNVTKVMIIVQGRKTLKARQIASYPTEFDAIKPKISSEFCERILKEQVERYKKYGISEIIRDKITTEMSEDFTNLSILNGNHAMAGMHLEFVTFNPDQWISQPIVDGFWWFLETGQKELDIVKVQHGFMSSVIIFDSDEPRDVDEYQGLWQKAKEPILPI